MNNYDAGGTMDTFLKMPLVVAYTVKMVSILLSHPMELIRVNVQANVMKTHRLTMSYMFKKMSRHGLYGYYYGIMTAGVRCTVQTFSSYHLFNNLREKLHDNPYFLMLRPFHNDAIKGLGGLGGGILATPFAKLSIIRQADLTLSTYHRHNYRTFLSGIKCMYRKGGLKYLFTGWRINAFSSALVAALHKPVSHQAETFAARIDQTGDDMTQSLISMALTGCAITLIMTPIDTLAVMALSHSRYRDFTYTEMCKKIIQKHGYSGFFWGLKPGLLGLIPHTIMATLAYRLLLIYNPPETPPDWKAASSGRSSWPTGTERYS